MQDFQAAVDAGKEKEEGWVSAAYSTSKAGLIGGTRAFAKKVGEEGSGVSVVSCCPGYVNTDMSKGNGTKTPDQGAMTPVLLALGDEGKKSGTFWRDEREIKWEDL
jgi:carbonyl reductase 1